MKQPNDVMEIIRMLAPSVFIHRYSRAVQGTKIIVCIDDVFTQISNADLCLRGCIPTFLFFRFILYGFLS